MVTLDEEPRFGRAPNGRVHVVRERVPAAILSLEADGQELSERSAWLVNLELGRLRTWCGRLFIWHVLTGVSSFEDDALCRRCHDRYPDPAFLFECNQPGLAA